MENSTNLETSWFTANRNGSAFEVWVFFCCWAKFIERRRAAGQLELPPLVITWLAEIAATLEVGEKLTIGKLRRAALEKERIIRANPANRDNLVDALETGAVLPNPEKFRR